MSSGGFDASRSAAGDRNPWLIAVVVSIATFMEVLDTSIANVALRHIAGSVAVSLDESTWVLTSYLVANAVVLPISGWLSNVIGRKRFYMFSVALFTISSLLCGLAGSLSQLIFFRILQGIGGGGLAPSEQSMLADSFPPEKRAQAFAVYGVAVIVAPTLGPTIGGWITDNYSWHWIFFINVPMGMLSLGLVHWLVVEPETLKRERAERLTHGFRIDYIGFALVALCLGCLEIVLDRGQIDDWFNSSFIATFAVISGLSLLALVPWELARPDPIFDVRLLLRRQFGTSCLVMLAVFAILLSSTQLLPQLLQTSFGYTATWAGLVLMPGGMAMFVLMPVSGQVTGRVAPKYVIIGGLTVTALAMWHLTTLTADADFRWFAWARTYQMCAMPFMFIPITSASYVGLPPDKTSEASALINVARNLGGSFGISMTQTLLARREQFHQSRLVEHIAPSSLSYQQALESISNYFATQGAAPPEARQQALAWIGQTVQTQASLLSYIDVFAALAAVAALMIVPAAILLRPARRAAPGTAD